MRWFWFDRFTEFESGSHATSVKNVSLAEEQVHDHFPGAGTMPNSLILEGLAQTSGMLVAEYYDFQERVILAKVPRLRFHLRAVPGDTLIYRAKIDSIEESGARVSVTSHRGEELQAEAEIIFAHLDRHAEQRQLFEPNDFAKLLRTFGVFEVGRKPDGSRIRMPAHLAEAEARYRSQAQA
ncbi:MAG: beta-hydroxyacyl-ACP dehydratase [Planctomycetia bacterium]|nr:beta-hydroxyacyl-ACP dehydratase [Planctomycetia bacterium]